MVESAASNTAGNIAAGATDVGNNFAAENAGAFVAVERPSTAGTNGGTAKTAPLT